MKFLVVDVAAESGGALTILESFYDQFAKDTANDYILCVNKPSFQSTANVKVMAFPWVKKSWLHRLWFDIVIANQIIHKHKIDEVFSLQNVVVPVTKKPQTIYLHQSLPFEEKRFSLLDAPLLWAYQNLIGPIIILSAKRARKIIVQTNWMKEAVINRAKIPGERIEVRPPDLEIKIPGQFSLKDWQRTFFYPATPLVYKNHITLLKAAQILRNQGIRDFKVLLTTTKQSLPRECEKIVDEVEDHITFLGSISHEEVMQMYCQSVLVFPSYIETYGLPLKEASLCGAPIIAADRPFSKEILENYPNKLFFSAMDSHMLAKQLELLFDKKSKAEVRL